jgi:hypothetical protein
MVSLNVICRIEVEHGAHDPPEANGTHVDLHTDGKERLSASKDIRDYDARLDRLVVKMEAHDSPVIPKPT